MWNMKNSIIEEPLIHISIWIRNDDVMLNEEDQAEGSRRSLQRAVDRPRKINTLGKRDNSR